MMETTSNSEVRNPWPGRLFILFLYCGLLAFIHWEIKSAAAPESKNWTAENEKKLASKLKAEGLIDSAAVAYEEYLRLSDADRNTRASIYFTLGKSFMSKNEYEAALSYFYASEVANPESSFKKELGIEIVTCLEKMGKSLEAQAATEERVSLPSKKKTQATGEGRDKPIAQIGSRVITAGEIQDRLQELPPFLQNRFKGEAAITEFVRQYLISEVMLKKAKSLQYQKDPEVRRKREIAEESILIQKVVQENITDKIQADEQDLRNYYKAHEKDYQEEKDGEVKAKPFEEVYDQVRKDFFMEKMEVKMKDFVATLFVNYGVKILAASPIESLEPAAEPQTVQETVDAEPTAVEPAS